MYQTARVLPFIRRGTDDALAQATNHKNVQFGARPSFASPGLPQCHTVLDVCPSSVGSVPLWCPRPTGIPSTWSIFAVQFKVFS